MRLVETLFSLRTRLRQFAPIMGVFLLVAAPACFAEPAHIEAQNISLDWNAVALAQGHIFVAGPRWTGFPGPSVATVTPEGMLRPFPSPEWNDWKPGQDARTRFVSVNALHLGPDGTLWVVDTGSPQFGGAIVRGGAKLVRIDPANGKIVHVYPMGPDAAPDGSYIDDIRFNGDHAYLTDAGTGAILVLDIPSGTFRRVLAGHPATMARKDRPIVVDGQIVRIADGTPLRVNVDPLEVSPDGRTLYFGPLEGPWSQVPTRALDDSTLSPEALAASVTPWADLPPIGGSLMDKQGTLYFLALGDDTIYRRESNGKITALLTDHRLHWADAPFLSTDDRLWFPVAQLDRLAQFNHGHSAIRQPFLMMSVAIRN
ncbi:major royal jelly family protein [Asaia krungthepensis]|uniref:Major royal jelly protein n=1 Tax=Asaia krungthepensis NRIC 0535 TaxID=1307925 RepID=A0ABQ0Q3C0_9PROT|nr:major royal jelly family protein [Asaia krungthepensis]GBQ89439.1 hypothetical protein AA0535_1795 [Asaia krungthepensis NRIC 0535]